jgi:hypothetical protein
MHVFPLIHSCNRLLKIAGCSCCQAITFTLATLRLKRTSRRRPSKRTLGHHTSNMDPNLSAPNLVSNNQLFQPYNAGGRGYGRGRGFGGGYAPRGFGGPRGGMFQPGVGGPSGHYGGGAPGSFVLPMHTGNAAPPPPPGGTNIIIQVPSIVEAEIIAATGFICTPGNFPPLLSFVEQSVRNQIPLFCFFFSVADQVIVGRAQIASSIKPRAEIPPHLMPTMMMLPENWSYVARVSNPQIVHRSMLKWVPNIDMTDPTARDQSQEQESIGGFARVVSRHLSFVMAGALAAVNSALQMSALSVSELSVFRAYMDDVNLWYDMSTHAEATSLSPEALDLIVNQQHVMALSKDVLGTLVFLRAMRQFGSPVITRVSQLLTALGDASPFWELLSSSYGSLILSTIYSHANNLDRKDLALLELWQHPRTVLMTSEASAANIITALINFSSSTNSKQSIGTAFLDAVVNSLAGNKVEDLSCDLHASRVIQHLVSRFVHVALEEGPESRSMHASVYNRCLESLPALIMNPLGNYVSSAVVLNTALCAGFQVDATAAALLNKRSAIQQFTNQDFARANAMSSLLTVCRVVGPHLVNLACNKYGSQSLEKFVGTPPIVEQFVNIIVADRNIVLRLAMDPFANYFLQKVLAKLPTHRVAEFVQLLTSVEGVIASGQYSKGVWHWLNRTRTQLQSLQAAAGVPQTGAM